jgi:hypothetical protein
MKIIINKIASFLVAFLVLFSTFSFTVYSHYFNDFLIIASYIDEPKVCKSDIKVDFYLKIKDCCTNEIQTIKGQDELYAHVSKKLATTKEQFINAAFIFHSILIVDEFSQKNTYNKKSLKNIPGDNQVQYQYSLF